jgi:hypothetical protein
MSWLVLRRGNSRTLRFPLLDEDGEQIDTMGATGRFILGDLLNLPVDFEEDPEVSGGEANIATVTLAADDLDDAPWYRVVYDYEIEVTDGTEVTDYYRGHAVVLPDLD